MPPAVIAVIATVATVAVKVYVASQLLAAILLVAIAVAASALMKKSAKALSQGQELQLKLDPVMPRQIALGRTATGGSLVWAFTYTDDASKPNRYLVRIIQISDLPITDVVSVRNGKEEITFGGDITTGLQASHQHRSKKNAACLWMRVYKGATSAAADANLVTWSDGLWTSAHRGDNLAYAIIRMDNDPDAYPSGEPQFIFEVDGAKVYDERYDSTAGGSGSQRLATPSTWAFSRNASVLATNVLRGLYAGGVLLFGAQAEARDLETPMLFAAHNICDSTIEAAGGVSMPRYRAGIMTNSAESTGSILLELQSAFDGRIVDRGGAITLRPGAVRTPVMHFTDDDIVWTEQKSWQPRSSLPELVNHVVGTYVSEENGYQDKSFPPLRNPTWEVNDGGERFTQQMTFRAVSNPTQVQYITKRVHDSSRYQGTVAFVVPFYAVEMEQDDWFTMTSERWGFTMKTFVAQKVDIIMADQIMVAIFGREIAADSGSWDEADEVPRGDTFWNPPSYDLQNPDIQLFEYYAYDESSLKEDFGIRVEITGFPDYPAASYLEIHIALASSLSNVRVAGFTTATNQTYTLVNLLPDTLYAVRIKAYDGKRFADPTIWEYITTPGSQQPIGMALTALDESIHDDLTDIEAMIAGVDMTNANWRVSRDNILFDEMGNPIRTVVEQVGVRSSEHQVFITDIKTVNAGTGIGKALLAVNADGVVVGQEMIAGGGLSVIAWMASQFVWIDNSGLNPIVPMRYEDGVWKMTSVEIDTLKVGSVIRMSINPGAVTDSASFSSADVTVTSASEVTLIETPWFDVGDDLYGEALIGVSFLQDGTANFDTSMRVRAYVDNGDGTGYVLARDKVHGMDVDSGNARFSFPVSFNLRLSSNVQARVKITGQASYVSGSWGTLSSSVAREINVDLFRGAR